MPRALNGTSSSLTKSAMKITCARRKTSIYAMQDGGVMAFRKQVPHPMHTADRAVSSKLRHMRSLRGDGRRSAILLRSML